jgi:D-beta-D-heptose 7-phosphate kinase/D-beta-D-heptose 1-phosphate adenosyltransferase
MDAIGHLHENKTLIEHIDRFPKAKVFVIGDIIMDEYIWGKVSRISPEAPVPVVEVHQETKMLGGAANVIHNMATLGAKPILCGVIGEDRMGSQIMSRIHEMGLKAEGMVVEKGRPTSIKTRIVAHNQQVVRFDRESKKDITPESIEKILNYIESHIEMIDALVVSDYGKGVISEPLVKGLRDLVRSASKKSIVIAVDPKTGNFDYYHGVDVITPNHHEAGNYCGFEIQDEERLLEAGRRMLDELHCRSVLITQGKDGVTLFERGEEVTHIPTVAKKVFDVTGAGDTVISVFSLGLASGMDPKYAAVLSNIAAGIVVGEVGTSTVGAEELKKAIGE